ncbi:Fic/DOC family N-terminal domain-containing protein [Candidatus Halobeggiatoa sp. HSG11]|nr:Fic/DOC family N-terminal domain-containing protein [Candidatus Halobeggiatoa sp. HSG11]
MQTLTAIPPNCDLETKPILKKSISANKKLAELKGIIKTIPNEAILINTLYIQEAKDSSAIENIITTHDEIYKQTLFRDLIKNSATKEVENYGAALQIGFARVKEYNGLSLNHILEIQQIIEGNKAGFRKLPGTELKNELTGEIIYTPPQDANEIQFLLNNLETYINADADIDPLICMAVIHYQFESIHPFYDGNGRTGRVINILYLVLKQLLDLPALYLSRYIIQHKADYYRLLQEVRTKNNWEAWILYMLDAVETTAGQTTVFVEQITALMKEQKHKIRTDLPKIYSQDLLNNLFKHPYTKIGFLTDDLQVHRNTAAKYLDELAKIKILKKEKIGKSSFYINTSLLNLIFNAFHL